MNKIIVLSLSILLVSGCAFSKATKLSAMKPSETIATGATLGGLVAKIIGGRRQWELDKLQHRVNVGSLNLKIDEIALESTKVKLEHGELGGIGDILE